LLNEQLCTKITTSMKIQTIVRPNQKGQMVIPKEVRKQLGIDADSQLHLTVTGSSFVITPLTDQNFPHILSKKTYAEVLAQTKGAWANDDWSRTEQTREKLELAAARQRKKTW